MRNFVKTLRSYFIYGLILILPITATIFILHVSLQLLTAPFENLFGEGVSSFVTILLSLCIITILGFFSRHFIGQFLIDFLESFISRIPVISKVYESFKQITHAISTKKNQSLKPILVEYPRKEMWTLGFVTQTTLSQVKLNPPHPEESDFVSVFIPTTPNPTSGYFVFVHKNEIRDLDISYDTALKMLISAGIVSP